MLQGKLPKPSGTPVSGIDERTTIFPFFPLHTGFSLFHPNN